MKLSSSLGAVLLALSTGVAANASLMLSSQVPVSGAGLGNVNTILTVQSPGNSTTEAGCVAFGSGQGAIGSCFGTVATGGNEQTGASQTQTRTIGQSGATSGANFAIVLNAVEPAGNAITVDALSVRFYSSTGMELYTASLAAPVTINNTLTGTGSAGFLFVLDSTQAAQATAAGAFSNTANVIGLAARLSQATGGPDTFFVGNLGTGGGGVGSEIPEPTTIVMGAAGLLLVAMFRKRRTA